MCRRQLRSHVDTVQGLLAHAVLPAERRPLAAVLADAATLAGWQAVDTGAVTEAWQHYEPARRPPAKPAHPRCSRTRWANRRMRCSTSAGPPTPSTSYVLHAPRPVHRSRRCWPAGSPRRRPSWPPQPADCADPGLPYLLLGPAHLTRWRGSALARLGDADATEHLYSALDGMGATRTLRAQAGLRVDLVAALTAAGDVDQATTEATTAGDLATRAGSMRLRRRLDQLTAA